MLGVCLSWADDAGVKPPAQETKIEALQREISQVQRFLEVPSEQGSLPSEGLQAQYQRLASILDFHLSLLEDAADVGENSVAASTALDITIPQSTADFNFNQQERLRLQVENVAQSVSLLRHRLSQATARTASAEQEFEEAERARRLERDRAGVSGKSGEQFHAPPSLEQAQLASRIASAERDLAREEQRQLEQKLRGASASFRTIQAEAAPWLEKKVFTEADLRAQLSRLDAVTTTLEQRAASGARTLSRAEIQLNRLRSSGGAGREGSSEPGDKLSIQAAVVESLRFVRNAVRLRIETLETQKQLWILRFQIAHGQSSREAALDTLRGSKESLTGLVEVYSSAMGDFLRQLAATNELLSRTDKGQAALTAQKQSIEQQIEVTNALLSQLQEGLLFVDRIKQEIPGGSSWSLMDAVQDSLRSLAYVWNFELFQVDDNSLTAGKIFLVFVLVVVGYFLARFASRQLGERVLRRLNVTVGASVAIQSIVFYLLILLFALFALHILHIPLTVFTVIGGALALGVGLGSQNLMNNFISGLLLLVEQPVRIGDIVEFSGMRGTVTRIGARSTILRTSENLEVIVPNSHLLDNHLINWTLGDDIVRRSITIGVAYGSQLRDVNQMLLRAVQDHGLVLKSPEPVVLFKDFGDNALVFELRFWVRLRGFQEALRIESDLRHKIDTLFREAKISIAFPQRDIHLFPGAELPVRILTTERADIREEEEHGNEDREGA